MASRTYAFADIGVVFTEEQILKIANYYASEEDEESHESVDIDNLYDASDIISNRVPGFGYFSDAVVTLTPFKNNGDCDYNESEELDMDCFSYYSLYNGIKLFAPIYSGFTEILKELKETFGEKIFSELNFNVEKQVYFIAGKCWG